MVLWIMENKTKNRKQQHSAVSEYPIYMTARALSVDLAVIAKISFWQQSHAQGVGLQNYLAEQAT